MNREDFDRLLECKPYVAPFHLAVPLFSSNYDDRTLLYGYDVDRATWHLYVEDGEVLLHRYRMEASILRINFRHAVFPEGEIERLVVPNKRLYPERCDFEFCQWARQMKHWHLPFTKWDETFAHNGCTYFGET
jgi:hypothetical protein